jgi:SNF2 family DNA or RNA helicase
MDVISIVRKRKQPCPRRLADLERVNLSWDSFSKQLDVDIYSQNVHPANKRRKKAKPVAEASCRCTVPVSINKELRDGLDEDLYLGYFKLSAISVSTSFPLHELGEEDLNGDSDGVDRQVQSLEIVAGDGKENLTLVVKQKVVDPFCCCFCVQFEGNEVDMPSLAHLAKSRVITVTVSEQELNNLFKVSRGVFVAGNPLETPFSVSFLVHISDSYYSMGAGMDETETKIFTPMSRNVATVVAQLNPSSCPPHMQSRDESECDVYLPTFKRIQLFYATVKEIQRRRGCVDEIDVNQMNALIPGMAAVLRGYQLRAVGWMLNREGVMKWPGNEEGKSSLHPSWTHICPSSPSGDKSREFFMNFYTGKIMFEEVPSAPLPKGGIVADEMGLGKTVEILALILLHKKSDTNCSSFKSAFETLLRTYNLLPSLPCDHSNNPQESANSTLDFSSSSRANSVECHQVVSDGNLLPITSVPSPKQPESILVPTVAPPLNGSQQNSQPSGDIPVEGPPLPLTPASNSQHTVLENTMQAILPRDHQLVIMRSPKKGENVENLPVLGTPIKGITEAVGSVCAEMEECEQILCLCGVTAETEGEEYIQCEECYTWQHTKCVGFNQRISSHYKCIFCIGKKPIEAKSTLIVSPASIAKQWLNEIKKHTAPSTIKAVFYEGVQGMIHPYTLAHYDVVLTTYDVLRKELYNATTDGSRKKLRHQKKYRITPSPLMTLKWWRLCVDEAQMVESEGTRASEMCMHIKAENKWFVTGTPIQKEISDLYGLLLLLGVEPYQNKYWWKNLLWQPYLKFNLQPIAEVFSRLLWRNNKRDVASELGIPEQKESIEWLKFSPVEEHFYKKQQERCQGEAYQVLDRFNFREEMTLANVQDYAVKPLLAPLLKLRQACLHPHVVRGGIVSMKKTSMTMGDLLQKLIKRAKIESQESLRQLIGALNGLAGIYRIQEKWSDAVECYRTAMHTWREHSDELECDYTQRIHTMEALDELLQLGCCPCSRALADETLREQAGDLRKKFLEKKLSFVTSSIEGLDAASRSSADMELALKQCDAGVYWYGVLLDKSHNESFERQLLNSVNSDLAYKIPSWSARFAGLNFNSVFALKLWIYNRWMELESKRLDILSQVREVCLRSPTDPEVEEASQCHLRLQEEDVFDLDETRTKCFICRVEAAVDAYELTLFSNNKRHLEDRGASGTTAHGTRRESVLEMILKMLAGYVRIKSMNKDLVASAQLHLNLLEEMKKEFTFIRTAWQAASEWVQGYDELNVASVRFRLYVPGETLPARWQLNVLHRHEVEPKRYTLLGEKAAWENELRKTKGQYYYLQSLEKAKDIKEENLENCPICIQQLGKEWCVLPCGHPLCVGCTEQMQKATSPTKWAFSRRNEIRCPVCRAWAKNDEIYVVSTTVEGQINSKVKGDHSTKIEAVICKIISIHEFEPDAKILVFSQWLSALELIANGLKQNSIAYEYPYQKAISSLQKSLTVFKTLPRVNVLLLPLQMGSNGLNITEATHVILCEPSLNPSAEQQAVSRIHRMGQTRPTTVHRFYVNNTVEDKMYRLFHPDGEEGVPTERCVKHRTDCT